MDQTDLPSVTVAVSTMGARVNSIDLPDPRAGIDYLVLVQRPEPTCPTTLAARDDVRVVTLETIGLSNSRNAGLEMATGEMLLFADDDQDLDLDGICKLARILDHDPDLAIVLGWRREHMRDRGRSTHTYRITVLNSGRVCAPEFMVRRSAVLAAGVWFDPRFGVGAEFEIGEEFIFVADLLAAGLAGLSVPVVTGSHPDESTGDVWDDPEILRARQAVLRRVFGPWVLPVRCGYALRHRRHLGGVAAMLRFTLGVVPRR